MLDFAQTKLGLFASASILVPSKKQVSGVTKPMSARREMSSEKTSSKTGRMRSDLKRLTVLCSMGRMPHIHKKPTSSRVARAIFLDE